MPTGNTLPLWGELGRKFSTEMRSEQYSSPIEALSEYAHTFGTTKLVEKLAELLNTDGASLGCAHESFCALPFKWVVTTNFENLLEKGYERANRPCRPILNEDELAVDLFSRNHLGVNLVKLHGDLHHPKRMIVTEDDYDGFLDRYPLMSTFLASKLIFSTPLFIGYSVEDPDFRQIWRIVKNRLGKLSRPAYTIRINTPPAIRNQFERRGITVIDLPGERHEYDQIFGQVFRELGEYWNEVNSTRVRQQLSKDCFFSFNEELLPFYRTHIFPIANKHGFAPSHQINSMVLDASAITAMKNLVGAADALILDRLSPSQAISYGQGSCKPTLYVTEEGYLGAPEPAELVFRPEVQVLADGQIDQELLDRVDEWFKKLESQARPQLERRPNIMFEAGDFEEAVVGIVDLLLYDLRRLYGSNEIERVSLLSIPHLVSRAIDAEIFKIEDKQLIEKAMSDQCVLLAGHSDIGPKALIELFDSVNILLSRLSGRHVETFASVPAETAESIWKIESEFMALYEKFQDAIEKEDPTRVCELINPPITVNVSGTSFTLRKVQEIQLRYDALFRNSFIKTAIARAKLWQSWRGIATDGGELWFQPTVIDGRLDLTAINLS